MAIGVDAFTSNISKIEVGAKLNESKLCNGIQSVTKFFEFRFSFGYDTILFEIIE